MRRHACRPLVQWERRNVTCQENLRVSNARGITLRNNAAYERLLRTETARFANRSVWGAHHPFWFHSRKLGSPDFKGKQDKLPPKSPIDASDSRHHIEMLVSAQKWEIMLPTKRRDPEVIGRNGLSRSPKLNADCSVVMS